ncbi:MAG: hypothetical protein NZO58_11115, partial [Gemmataceae bacterium]|nr:hypothetical protein [Gemmataceae bacterium]
LQLSLAALRHEQIRPNGEKLLFDSDDLAGSTPELVNLKQHIGTTLALIRVDGYGRTLEVKHGSAAKYEAEPPFALVLPAQAPREGQGWVRKFHVVLEPPHGTGERHAAEQQVAVSKIADHRATLAITTTIVNPPASAQERLPLLQHEPRGQAVFDVAAGRLQRVHWTIDRTIEGHQGAGSSYQFASTYTEEFVEAK